MRQSRTTRTRSKTVAALAAPSSGPSFFARPGADVSRGDDVPAIDAIAQFDAVVALFDEPRGAHIMRGQVVTDEPRGAHVRRTDPLRAVEHRALHAASGDLLSALALTASTPDAALLDQELASTAPADDGLTPADAATRPARTRPIRTPKRHRTRASARRRPALIPVAGALGAVAVSLAGGAAYAYLANGRGHGDASTGSPVTVKAEATSGSADLLPGRPGTVYFTLHNPNSFGATFDQVEPGATVVSDDTDLCPSSDVTIAQALPYTIPAAVTVSPGGTSGTQSIADLVVLASNAPSSCQGVTFTVTLTFSGQSS
jgi:hypothetical protein